MKLFRISLVSGLVVVFYISALAQTAKTFTKEGLSFNYPAPWTLQDGSKSDAQQLTLARSDSDAQIRVFAYRSKLESPEKVAEAKHKLVDSYVDSTAKTFEQMGAHPERTPASIEVGGIKAEGVKIRAVLEGEPGAAEIYWAVLGDRLVVLTFFGPDRSMKQASAAWDTVRNSVQIEGPKPAASPTPKP